MYMLSQWSEGEPCEQKRLRRVRSLGITPEVEAGGLSFFPVSYVQKLFDDTFEYS